MKTNKRQNATPHWASVERRKMRDAQGKGISGRKKNNQ
jgi:hypothetical protein